MADKTISERLQDIKNSLAGSLTVANQTTGLSDTGVCDAILHLKEGYRNGASDVNIESGSFTVASDTVIGTSGYSVPATPGFLPDYFCVWMDNDTFVGLATPTNNCYYRFGYTRIKSNVPPLHSASNVSWQSASKNGVSFFYNSNVNNATGTASTTGYGISTTYCLNAATIQYASQWSVSDAGEFRIGKFSTATNTLKAGNYNWVAIKGIPTAAL